MITRNKKDEKANIRYFYFRGFSVRLRSYLFYLAKFKRFFRYIVYEVPQKPFSGKIVLAGDSFTVQYEQQLIDSKFANKKNITIFDNQGAELRRNIKKVIDGNDIIIVMYREASFFGPSFKATVDIFYNYLKSAEADSRKQKQK